MIEYPRKCPHCDHMASSPQTFSYHKRTHKPIPPGTLCCGGCGQEAKFITTNNNMWCCKEFSHCPQQAIEKSDRAAQQWKGADDRKAKMVETLSDPAIRAKNAAAVRAGKRRRLIITENESPKEMKQYKRLVHSLSQATYHEHQSIINPDNHKIGRRDYHLDHKVSKHVGWLLQIPAKYIASCHNLAVIPSTINEGKGPTCSIFPSTLLELCEAPTDLIEAVRSQELQLVHLIALQ